MQFSSSKSCAASLAPAIDSAEPAIADGHSAPLPLGLVHGNRHGVGKVQTAHLGPNWYSQQPLAMCFGNRFRQARGFAAEYKYIAGPIINVEVIARGPFAEQVWFTAAEPCDERFPIIDDFPLQVLPIIEARPTEIIIIDAETERAHQPKLAAGGHAGAAHRTGIVRNLWMVQNNVQERFVLHSRANAGRVKK